MDHERDKQGWRDIIASHTSKPSVMESALE